MFKPDLDFSSKRRQQLYGLLGDLPNRQRPIQAKTIGIAHRQSRSQPQHHYIVETLILDLNGIEGVPAYFVKPADISANEPMPCVIFNHSHGGNYVLGKNELLDGNVYLHNQPYAEALTAQGYTVLAIDHWLFGERRGRSESELFKYMLWHGQVLWGMMVYDSLRALDYVCSRTEVDSQRIATLGLSMGSTMAWWLAALDERVRVCIDLCCMTDFQALIETRGLDGHGIYYYVPSLLKHFTTAEINALIAPRPHLSLNGNQDRLTPASGLDWIDAELKQVYAAHAASPAWQLKRYETGHFETAEMRAEVLTFLGQWL
ncbi:MAG: acetylxylan esterase [Anaerolineae bacterium]|nr:acetylxylan esterase [Anaerolineae bacterium]